MYIFFQGFFFILLALKPEKALHVACGRAHTIVACGKYLVFDIYVSVCIAL